MATAEVTWPQQSGDSRADDMSAAERILVVFSDYEGPACREAQFELYRIARLDGFGIVIRHMPNPSAHPMAEGAAKSAIWADRPDRFRVMNERCLQTSAGSVNLPGHASQNRLAFRTSSV